MLLYADGDDSTLHAEVANVWASLINEAEGRLEALLKRYRSGEFRAAPGNASGDRSPTIRRPKRKAVVNASRASYWLRAYAIRKLW